MAKKKTPEPMKKTKLQRVIELTDQLRDIYAQVEAGKLSEWDAEMKISSLNRVAEAEDLPFRAVPKSVNPWATNYDTNYIEEDSDESSDF